MKKRILFVEDNPVLLQMYAMMMDTEHERWEVVTMEDARQALGLLENSTFHVVVSDLHMPGMDGIQFLSHVQKRLPGPTVCGRERVVITVRCTKTVTWTKLPRSLSPVLVPEDQGQADATVAAGS